MTFKKVYYSVLPCKRKYHAGPFVEFRDGFIISKEDRSYYAVRAYPVSTVWNCYQDSYPLKLQDVIAEDWIVDTSSLKGIKKIYYNILNYFS